MRNKKVWSSCENHSRFFRVAQKKASLLNQILVHLILIGIIFALFITAVAGNVKSATRTSSPGLIPKTTSARCRAVVQELMAKAYLHPIYSATNASNSAVFGPCVRYPVPGVTKKNENLNAVQTHDRWFEWPGIK